jgi:TnpA family transposase
VDGTKWDLRESNLLSEYHIRYQGYGGIGYYHVSDQYIALFSHFIPCGVWEASFIFDGLINNPTDIKPDTVYGDTQAQNAPVFGLAHLLGIQLMPRIRNWKDIRLFKPSKGTKYKNIEPLFSDDPINWRLIETHLQDMMQVVLSIKAGKITPSTILRKLGTSSRKNRLYFAFRELGRVVRTVFLLKYINNRELRIMIQAATNKSESYNDFTQWVLFGDNGIISENDREQQRKIIKYNHLVANLIIFHNVYSMTNILNDLAQEGFSIDRSLLASLSPYQRDHINRYGDYSLNVQKQAPPLKFKMEIENAA